MHFGSCISPLFPETHSYPAVEPFIYYGNWTVILRKPVIVHPAPHVLCKFVQAIFHGDAPASSGKKTYSSFELTESIVTPSAPDLRLDTGNTPLADCVDAIVEHILQKKIIHPASFRE